MIVIYGQHDHLILHHGTFMYGVIKREFIELTGIYKECVNGQHRERQFGRSSGRTLGEF